MNGREKDLPEKQNQNSGGNLRQQTRRQLRCLAAAHPLELDEGDPRPAARRWIGLGIHRRREVSAMVVVLIRQQRRTRMAAMTASSWQQERRNKGSRWWLISDREYPSRRVTGCSSSRRRSRSREKGEDRTTARVLQTGVLPHFDRDLQLVSNSRSLK